LTTATDIINNYRSEIEKYFIKIDESVLEDVNKKLEDCKENEISDLKAKKKLLQDYLYGTRY